MNIVKTQMAALREQDTHRVREDSDDRISHMKQNKNLAEQLKVIEVMSARFDTVGQLVETFKKKLWEILVRSVVSISSSLSTCSFCIHVLKHNTHTINAVCMSGFFLC